MRNQKLRYTLGKLINYKMTSAFYLFDAVGAGDKLLRQLRRTAADRPIGRAPDVER